MMLIWSLCHWKLRSFWLETEDGPEEYDGPLAEDDGEGGFFDEAFHFVTVEHVE
jgi:hypothetical protein